MLVSPPQGPAEPQLLCPASCYWLVSGSSALGTLHARLPCPEDLFWQQKLAGQALLELRFPQIPASASA